MLFCDEIFLIITTIQKILIFYNPDYSNDYNGNDSNICDASGSSGEAIMVLAVVKLVGGIDDDLMMPMIKIKFTYIVFLSR